MATSAYNNRLNGSSTGFPLDLPSQLSRLNVNLPLANPAGSFGLAILSHDYLLDLELIVMQNLIELFGISAQRKGAALLDA